MAVTHFDEAPAREFAIGHLGGRWTFLGDAAGSRDVGVRRLQVHAGGWTTPAHEHGRDEEIFYVLAGRGISWQAGSTSEVGSGDCVVYLAGGGAHTMHALEDLDVLAFGPRNRDEAVRFPRLGLTLLGNRMVQSDPASVGGAPLQFLRESELGPPELPAHPGERPPTIVNVDDPPVRRFDRPRIAASSRDLGRAAGSITTGLRHVTVDPGKEGAPPHCHSVEEEIFVVLDGDGVLTLFETDGELDTPVRAGSVIARPPGTAVAHCFRAGGSGLTYLAYGTRDSADVCYYPRSGKIALRGVGLIGRIEPLDYFDGED
jgi:uncharacterized cupin superfamily protein